MHEAARRLSIPYGGTFLTFSDYSRACRMAALMKQRVIHVFTHDSIGSVKTARRTVHRARALAAHHPGSDVHAR